MIFDNILLIVVSGYLCVGLVVGLRAMYDAYEAAPDMTRHEPWYIELLMNCVAVTALAILWLPLLIRVRRGP